MKNQMTTMARVAGGCIVAVALCLLTACDTKAPVRQRADRASADTTAADGRAQRDAAETEVPGRGELGLFDLRGPVKSCEWNYGNGQKETLTFDRHGLWLTRDGKSPSDIYPLVERDEMGRIRRFADEGEEAEVFEYNEQGLMIRHAVTGSQQTYEAIYAYDANGDVVSITDSDLDWITGETSNPVESTFVIEERDDHGNWTRRTGQSVTGRSVETRTITYYGGAGA